MANKTDFDNELITTFLQSFKRQFNIFVDKIKKEQCCRTCDKFCNGCKGIESYSGQKNCLINRLNNFSENGNSTLGSQTISLWLSGKANYLPSLSLLKKVAIVMDCKLDDFFDENTNQTFDNYNYLKNKVIGHYGIYEMYQEKRKFSYGILSIIKSPVDGQLKAYAIFQIRNDNDMIDKVEKLQEDCELNQIYKNNSYIGNVEIDKYAIYITFTHMQQTVRDKLYLIIPNTLNFQDNFALQENKVNYDGNLLGGYGVLTCLNNHIFREALSIPLIFSKNPIEIDDNLENMNKIFKNIENDEFPTDDFTERLVRSFYNKNVCITQEMEEELVEYLMDDVE